MKTIRTTCSQAFDHSYAKRGPSYWHELYPGRSIVVSDVEVPDEHAEHQRDRFLIGSFMAVIL